MTATRAPRSAVWPTLVVGALTFAAAYDDGAYRLTTWSAAAVGVWWAVLVGVAVGIWPRGRLTRAAVVPGALLAALAAWDIASVAWSSSAEDAYAEFDRTALYLGVYVLVVLTADGRRLGRWIDGLAAAIAVVAVVALVSRLFPGSFPSRGVPASLPSAARRLAFPLDYWNGLGIFVALAFPLLLASALAPNRRRRMVAVGLVPALGGTVYLTSSRGAVVALAAGVAVFVAAEPRRWAALGAALAGGAGTATAIAVLAVRRDDWATAVLVVLVCVATAAAFEAGSRHAPEPPALSRRAVAAALLALATAGVAALLATHAYRDFTRVPPSSPGAAGTHLLSGGGSGRWQFWQAAVDEFRNAPLHGGGAGSFESWWNQHGSFSYAVKDAHSLYLETLGELGVVGFVLLAGALAAAVTAGVRRLRRADLANRTPLAALLGAATAYLVGASVDWMWELTAVTIAGVCALALLAAPAARPARVRAPVRLAAAAIAGCVAVAEAIVLLAAIEVNESQAAARAGRLGSARAHAVAATKLEPWAATPHLQLALVEESASNLAAADRSVAAAIERDRDDWRPWLVAARIERRLGDADAAARSHTRARSLNPRSPLLSRQP